MEMIGIFLGILFVMAVVVYIKANMKICEPNEVMIFTGRTSKDRDGAAGYRIIKGGRAMKIPFIETVRTISLNTIPIEIEVRGALTRGTIPVNVKAMANVKVAGTMAEGLGNAIERFLGKSPAVISATAREILEGALRGVLATMEPEEANADRIGMAKRIYAEVREDMQRMGLVLDMFKVQEIKDEKGYLEAIARKKNAEVHRDARIVEAEANAEAGVREAESRKVAEIADIEAKKAVVAADLDFKVRQASWRAGVNQAEEKAKLAGEIAKMEETRLLEERRLEANRLKYQAEVVVPAEAEKEAKLLKAVGEAAFTLEEGRAKAEALRRLKEQWAGEETRDLFVIQMMPELVEHVSKIVAANLNVERITVLDNGGGGGVPSLVGNLAGSVNSFFEQMRCLTGLDITRLAEKAAGTDREGESLVVKGPR